MRRTSITAETRRATAAPALVPIGNLVLEAFPPGVLWWADERLLVVADLHLEKGSAYARRGSFLPPYDTGITLGALAAIVRALAPRRVISLGDSFHDDDGPARLMPGDAAMLAALQAGRDWIWVAGNHDPHGAAILPGDIIDALALGPVLFRHEPTGAPGEIAGHLHPAARVAGRLGSVRCRCFVGDGSRLVMPAFGAYAGGLNVLDRAFAPVFPGRRRTAWAIGADGIYRVRQERLRPD